MTLFNKAFKNTHFIESNDHLEWNDSYPFGMKMSTQLICAYL